MTSVAAIGVLQVALLLGADGVGLPLGIPPAAEDPAMAAVAPPQCLAYVTWAGTASPNASSSNRTERLLAEPGVQKMLVMAGNAIKAGVAAAAKDSDPETAKDALALVAALTTHPAAAFLADFDPPATPNAPPKMSGGLIVNLGDDAAAVSAAIDRLIQKTPRKGIVKVKIGDTEFSQYADEPEVTWGLHGKYFVLGFGKNQVEGMLGRMKQPPPAWLTAARKHLPVDRQSLFALLNVKMIQDKVTAAGGDQAKAVIEALGLSNVTAVGRAEGLDNDGLVSRTLLGVQGEPAGIPGILKQTPLTAEDLAPLPKDSIMAVALRLDLDRVWRQGLEIAAAIEPSAVEEFRGQLSQAEAQLGFKIREDLLQGLGDTWRIAYAPPLGAVPIPRVLVVVNVRDSKRLTAAHAKLIALAEAMLAQQGASGRAAAKINRSQQGGREVFSVQLPPGLPIAPSWCITEKELVAALTPQGISEYFAKPAGAGSLADVPEVAAAMKGEAPPFVVVYQNSPELIRGSYPALAMLLAMFSGELQKQGITVDASALPPVDVLVRHMRPSVTTIGWGKVGLEMTGKQTIPMESMASTSPVAIALLLPAVQAAREAARRSQSTNNLKQIGLALHNYHDANKAFPPAYTVDKQGKPGLSWRVMILPYIEEQELYKQFHLDEPWDSEHNKPLNAKIPRVYVSPNYSGPAGKTNYLGIGGPHGVFSGKDGTSMAKITDGTANTIMVVESNNAAAVEWTKPDVFVPDEKDPTKGLKGLRPGGFNALLCDGSVRFIAETIAPGALRAFWSIDGGASVEP